MTQPVTQPVTQQAAGEVREHVWAELMRTRAASYPLPPQGHQPNFRGAREAAAALLAHPQLAAHRCLIAGPERALYALRRSALEAGLSLYVPDQRREGWYVLIRDPAGADLKRGRALGEPKLRPEGATAAVLACVAVDRLGGRLGKGFGWAARGVGLGLPEYTLAHPRMLLERLPCPPDSRVQLIGLPGEVIEASEISEAGGARAGAET